MRLFTVDFKHGHYFEFTNELNYPVDSLSVSIGKEINWVYNQSESSTFGANLKVPKKGYPHAVNITVYSGDNISALRADSFSCYNCDGSHEYILRKQGAEYRFHN
jgi:hypothetical protein